MVPTVAVAWRDLDLPHVDTVANDDLAGGALATRHLLELGHRRIAHIAGHVPGSANAVGAPMTYMAGGKQFIVFPVGGGPLVEELIAVSL